MNDEPGKIPGQTVVRAWARLMRAQRLALAAVEEALKAAQLPPLAWYDVLLELDRPGSDGLRPVALERETLFEQYNLSRLIDRLEKAGLVDRHPCPEDGRGQCIRITEAGRAMRRRMWPVYGAAIKRALDDRMAEGEVEALDQILGRFLETWPRP